MAGEILKHILNRSLAHVLRFNSLPQHFSESVAEHSFYVAYIASILCMLLDEAGEKVNKEKIISMALVHDVEETFSGDILSPFKHYSSEVTLAIRKVNKEVIAQSFQHLPEKIASHFVALWTEEGESKTLEAQIVKMADRLSLVAKCAEEVKVGNEFFKKVYDAELRSLEDDQKPWWKKIKNEIVFKI